VAVIRCRLGLARTAGEQEFAVACGLDNVRRSAVPLNLNAADDGR